jgi:hypothetical protein
LKNFRLLSFVFFSSIFFLFFFLLLLHSQKKQRALLHTTTPTTKSASHTTTTTQQHTHNENKKINRSIIIKSNARRATIGRVLRRTRERARREAIERDRSSSGGEHREEQFRTRWVGQGILVKILFSNREKVNVGIAMDRFFLSLSLSLLKALRRARRLAEVLYLCIKLTSSFLF